MMFPRNIKELYVKSGKTTKEDTRAMKMLFIGILTIVFSLILIPLGNSLHIPLILTLIVQVILEAGVVVPYMRKKVFNEEDMKAEQLASRSESLANYYRVRDESDVEVKTSKDVATVMEYQDGTLFTAFKIRYGSTDEKRSEASRGFTQFIMNLLGTAKIDHKIYVANESYPNSVEYRNFLNTMSGEKISNDKSCEKLINVMLELTSKIEEDTRNSNVLCTTVFLRFQNAFQVMELKRIMRTIERRRKEINSSVRYIEYMDKYQLKDFYVQYFCIDAFDSRISNPIETKATIMNAYKRKITVHSIVTDDDNIVGTDTVNVDMKSKFKLDVNSSKRKKLKDEEDFVKSDFTINI